MAHKYDSKGIHTSPEAVGKNMPSSLPKDDDDNMLGVIVEASRISAKERQAYKGQWTEETFGLALANYFDYCVEKNLKPCKAGICAWLGCSKSQLYDWEKKQEKYGYKSELLAQANLIIEQHYIGRGEKYPTMNMFLLKTSHGHAETTNINVNSNSVNPDEVADAISKLGLDK